MIFQRFFLLFASHFSFVFTATLFERTLGRGFVLEDGFDFFNNFGSQFFRKLKRFQVFYNLLFFRGTRDYSAYVGIFDALYKYYQTTVYRNKRKQNKTMQHTQAIASWARVAPRDSAIGFNWSTLVRIVSKFFSSSPLIPVIITKKKVRKE